MSKWDYQQSHRITRTDPSFTSLIMAAMRRADTANMALLKHAFPAIWAELDAHYNSPGGDLPTDLTPTPPKEHHDETELDPSQG